VHQQRPSAGALANGIQSGSTVIHPDTDAPASIMRNVADVAAMLRPHPALARRA